MGLVDCLHEGIVASEVRETRHGNVTSDDAVEHYDWFRTTLTNTANTLLDTENIGWALPTLYGFLVDLLHEVPRRSMKRNM